MPRPCAVVLYVGRYAAQRRWLFDATALCRGSSRWFLISSPETNVNYHGSRPWHLQSMRASSVEANVSDHGTRPWHCIMQDWRFGLQCSKVLHGHLEPNTNFLKVRSGGNARRPELFIRVSLGKGRRAGGRVLAGVQDRGLGGVERQISCVQLTGGHADLEDERPDLDLIAVAKRLLSEQAFAVNQGAVRAAQIAQLHLAFG